MKTRPLSLPQKIRRVRKDLRHWMSLRPQNPIMGRDHLQEAAERESIRLAGVLDRLETQQREQMEAISKWRETKKGKDE